MPPSELTVGGRGPAGRTLHTCPAGGCAEQVSSSRLFCRADWYRVPKPLRDVVWRTWRSGKGAGTPEHTAAVAAAVDAVNGQTAGAR